MKYRIYVKFDYSSVKDQLRDREIVNSVMYHREGKYTQVLTLDDGEEITLSGVAHTEEAEK